MMKKLFASGLSVLAIATLAQVGTLSPKTHSNSLLAQCDGSMSHSSTESYQLPECSGDGDGTWPTFDKPICKRRGCGPLTIFKTFEISLI